MVKSKKDGELAPGAQKIKVFTLENLTEMDVLKYAGIDAEFKQNAFFTELSKRIVPIMEQFSTLDAFLERFGPTQINERLAKCALSNAAFKPTLDEMKAYRREFDELLEIGEIKHDTSIALQYIMIVCPGVFALCAVLPPQRRQNMLQVLRSGHLLTCAHTAQNGGQFKPHHFDYTFFNTVAAADAGVIYHGLAEAGFIPEGLTCEKKKNGERSFHTRFLSFMKSSSSDVDAMEMYKDSRLENWMRSCLESKFPSLKPVPSVSPSHDDDDDMGGGGDGGGGGDDIMHIEDIHEPKVTLVTIPSIVPTEEIPVVEYKPVKKSKESDDKSVSSTGTRFSTRRCAMKTKEKIYERSQDGKRKQKRDDASSVGTIKRVRF